ncbi:MFS transporter [Pelagicoccus sp. SDUM812003]|uniref:MFS transporter n=1 Tax=Pelagicoccus sp. SDUM812003 TaxID=3041267 RepID=UPI0028105B68|nr:MFS transporter [Pelagicoccus sp. SDUM812003]MDQ8201705.1 MFS transporter [Pelagicoccus sp. SDUM812003]
MNSDSNKSSGVHAALPDKIIGFKEKIGYASGDMASVLFFKVFSSFLMFFYTDIIGIEAAIIATMLWVTRIFDAFTDPVMGMICDRTKSPHGKFRPWLRWMVLPYAISGVLIFTVPDLSETMTIVYVYATYSLAMLTYTGINIPYGALMGVMTPHSSERTVLSSFRFYGAYAANLIVQATILILVVKLGGSEDGNTATQSGYVNTMILYAICAGLLFFFTFSATKERVQPPKGQETNITKDLAQLFKNKPWVAIIIIGITTIMWIAMRDAAILYYFKYYVVGQVEDGGRFAALATWFNVIGTIGTLLGVACTKWFTDIFKGKKNAYLFLTIIVSFVAACYYFSGPGDVTLVFCIQAITSFLMGPLMPLFWSMIADTADYSEWKFGRRFTGLTFSAGTFSQKLGWALGPAFAGYLLNYYGYVDNVAQSARTIEGLRMMMSLIPSGLALVAAALVMTYGINLKLERRIELELSERKAAEGSLDT